jgi:uncharacterized membrane protein YvbJ
VFINRYPRFFNKGEYDLKMDKKVGKKTSVLLALVVILVIGLFTSYQMLSKKYSEEAVIEQFKLALTKKEKTLSL